MFLWPRQNPKRLILDDARRRNAEARMKRIAAGFGPWKWGLLASCLVAMLLLKPTGIGPNARSAVGWSINTSFPLGLVVVVTLVGVACAEIEWSRRKFLKFIQMLHETQHRLCPDCQYSLTGHDPAGTCPECGHPFTPESLQDDLADLENLIRNRLPRQ